MPAAATVAGIALMGSAQDKPILRVLVKTMKPNWLDKSVLGIRKHVFVRFYDYLVHQCDTGGFLECVIAGICIPFLFLFGVPFMWYIRLRGLTGFLEDDDHVHTYPCRPIHGERGINWKREGF